MTIQGARDELLNMMECKDLPFYFVPILKEVAKTIEMEFTTACDIDAIPSADKWIPVTYRPMTNEEKKHYSEYTGYDEEDLDTMLDCPLPEDGEMVLITDRLGNVEVDTFVRDCDGCYFECNCDMEDVIAWQPLPKPYDPQESEDKE